MKYYLDKEKLAALVRSKRAQNGLRETACEIGNVSPSTLSRVERKQTPDIDTFLSLCEWLDVPPSYLIRSNEAKSLTTPDAIALYIKSDRNLNPNIAVALSALILAA